MAKEKNEPLTLEPRQQKKELTLSRVYNAPREKVFRAWSDSNQFAKWWGPNDFTNPVTELNVRPGGSIYIEMRGPDGTVYPAKGSFREIVSPEWIVFTMTPLDEEGNPLFETHNTITFDDEKGKTKLTVHAVVTRITEKAAPYLAGMEEGWKQTLARLGKNITL